MSEKTSAREKIKETIQKVKEGIIHSDEGMAHVDSIIDDLIGVDDTEQYDFPKLWTPSQRKNWVNSRNHMRRQLRSRYKH